ncbi:MAG TPA: DUF1559 domain-containing protein, partial [Gemmataceae bacterium]|nr:DUF1559 domain-containing protein [Gemmataceae bacterium]
MAIGTSFKQQCPSCEALVPVKDIALVGKKIECPKCKDKFIVKSPAKKKDAEEETPEPKVNGKTAPAAPGRKPAAPAGETKKGKDEDPKKAPAKGKQIQGEDDDKEGEPDAKKKKKAATSRFSMGLVLAVVGLLVLAAAAFFILSGNKGTPTVAKKGSSSPSIQRGKGSPEPTKENADNDDSKNKGKELSKDDGAKPRPVETAVSAATAELTNLLPNDTNHVAHVPFRSLWDQASPWRDALFQTPDALKDDFLRAKLGFRILKIDDLIRAERYGPEGWSFTVVHSLEIIDQEAVKKALDLKPAPMVKDQLLYRVGHNPWFNQLARVTLGVPHALVAVQKNEANRHHSLFVHFHNSQTMIFADEAPLVALLKEDKRFKSMGDSAAPQPVDQPFAKSKPANKKGKTVAEDPPPETADTKASPSPAPAARLETYVTIKPALKAMLDRMESTGPDGKYRVLFSSATDLDAARLDGVKPDLKRDFLWFPREIWDVALLLQDRNPRLRVLGVAIVQKDDRVLQIRNDLSCPLDNDARNLQRELAEDIAPDVARFVERLLAHKVELPKKEGLQPAPAVSPTPPVAPPPRPRFAKGIDLTPKEKEPPVVSKIVVTQNEKTVEFTLDLKVEQQEISKLHDIASLIGCGLQAAMEVAAQVPTRHDLAKAGKELPEKGLSLPTVLPGNYPPGAFHRKGSDTKRFIREPMQRVSWMAALLPFLGQESLFGKINFNLSWRDPGNWAPAGTMVAQFLDPTYPSSSYFLTRLDLPFDAAATHFVGIAGVGLDAADYDPADPATINKRGLLGYEKGMSLEEVRKGHGLANTMLMIQVPYDSMTGVTAWMAGGGSTLRGVPEKNSVAPFVTKFKDRSGTFALMADGSVRFVDQNVSDEVFKAMAAARGPLPENFDL